MSDSKQSTLTPELAQQALDTIAHALRSLDGQLERITRDLDTSGDTIFCRTRSSARSARSVAICWSTRSRRCPSSPPRPKTM